MKPKCEHCNDTGMLPGSSFLDCAHCGMAQERAELATFVRDFCVNYSGLAECLPAELNYAILMRGKALARKALMMTVKIDAEDAIKWLREVLASDESTRAELIAAGWIPPIDGDATREQAIDAAAHAVHAADAAGLVLTISQVSIKPLAMGNYETLVELRQMLQREES